MSVLCPFESAPALVGSACTATLSLLMHSPLLFHTSRATATRHKTLFMFNWLRSPKSPGAGSVCPSSIYNTQHTQHTNTNTSERYHAREFPRVYKRQPNPISTIRFAHGTENPRTNHMERSTARLVSSMRTFSNTKLCGLSPTLSSNFQMVSVPSSIAPPDFSVPLGVACVACDALGAVDSCGRGCGCGCGCRRAVLCSLSSLSHDCTCGIDNTIRTRSYIRNT